MIRTLLENCPTGLTISELMVKSKLPFKHVKTELDRLPVVTDGNVYHLYQSAEERALLQAQFAQAKIAQNRDKKVKRNPPFTPNPLMGYQVQKGKVKLFLDRRASSKTLTLTLDDLKELVMATEKGGNL